MKLPSVPFQLTRFKPLALAVCASTAMLSGCGSEEATAPVAEAGTATMAPAAPTLGIRVNGDEELAIDMSQIHNPQLREIFDYIDENIDEHVLNLRLRR